MGTKIPQLLVAQLALKNNDEEKKSWLIAYNNLIVFIINERCAQDDVGEWNNWRALWLVRTGKC